MKAPNCPRIFEAEAMRDGRLGDGERASFERHAKTCLACAGEVRTLDALAVALKGACSEPADELRVRRERTRLLAGFDRELVAPGGGSGAPRRWLWPMAAALVAAALLLFWRIRPAPPGTRSSGTVVHGDDGAVWSERVVGDRDEIVLERGELRIHVDHAAGQSLLRVVLPDGELEDRGTTFTVAVEFGRTKDVAVDEGSVVLRLHGEPSVAIGSRERWKAPTLPSPLPCAVSELPVDPPPSAPSFASPASSTPPSAARATTPMGTATPDNPSADFRAATSAFDRGDNRVAAEAFAGFLARHSRDPRAEDAAYLRVIALERCGDRNAMRAAAVEYLRRYPRGFRSTEVGDLAR